MVAGGFGGVPVDEVCGGVQGFYPKGAREVCLKQKGAHYVIQRTKDTLGFTVLRRCVRARHLKVNTVREKERAGGGVIKLAAVVTLYTADVSSKLSFDIGKELR